MNIDSIISMNKKGHKNREGDDLYMDYKLTRGSKRIIKEVIILNETLDPYELLPLVCEELWNRYQGEQLEYQLKRMRLETTGQVKMAIEETIRKTRI